MKKKTIMIGISAALIFSFAGMTTTFAHENINSGREFGQHVKKNNSKFSGTMNPGVHHKGYSTLKSKK